jgi:hypothetical protein
MVVTLSTIDKSILRRARRRYHALPIPERPALAGASVVGLFHAPELLALAQAGRWPLQPEDLNLIREPSSSRRRQRHSRQVQLLGDLADLIRARPDELRDLLWTLLKLRGVRHAETE